MTRWTGAWGLALATAGLVLAQGLAPAPATAEGCVPVAWTGAAANGSWSDPANWSTAAVPDAASGVTLSGATVSGVAGTLCSLTTTGGVDLSLDADVTVGTATLGAATVLHRPDAATGTAPQLRVQTLLTPTGDGVVLRDVGLAADTGALVALDGRTVSLTGTATSSLASGSTVGDASPAGTGVLDVAQAVTTGASLALTGAGTLRLSPGAALTASTTTVGGTGRVVWRGGTVTGDVTLALGALVETDSPKELTTGSALHVGSSTTTRLAGTLTVAGTLHNAGLLLAVPGARLLGTGGSLTNAAGAALRVDVTPVGGTSSPVTLDAVPLSGQGSLVVSPGERLVLTRTGWSAGSPALTASSLPAGTALRGGGTLRVGPGASLGLTGGLGVTEGTVLELDDGGDGSGAVLDADAATLLSPPKTDGTRDATLRWRSGVVRGQLTVDGAGTEIGSLSTSSGSATRRLVPRDDTQRARLVLRGPLSLQAARVLMAPRSDAVLAGESKLGAAAGFTYDGAGTPDASVTVAPAGSIVLAPVSISGLTIPSAGVFDVPLVNQGHVTLNASSLSATGGYRQEQPTGSTTEPTTGIYTAPPSGSSPPPQSTLTAGTSTVTIAAGGLFGKGTVKAATVSVGAGWLLPEVGTDAGTLTVEGDLALSPKSDVQLIVGGTTAALVDHLVVTGRATLGGRLTGLTRTGYTPAYLSTAASVMTFGSRTGTFASSAWSPTTTGLGFKPVYDDAPADGDGLGVDLRYVDVAPPALGLAGIPVVTFSDRQRITFAGIDNKTGVAGFDVRVRRSSPGSVGPWVYPAAWQNQAATFTDHTGLVQGWTYCYAVRARDKAGNVTGWSSQLCTTRMADDRTAAAVGPWTRPGGVKGFSGGTFSRTTTPGAYLRLTGASTRVAVTALRCPTCGTIDVYLAGKRLGRVDLRSSTSALRTWTSAAYPATGANVYVKVVTSGRPVVIDAVALQRVP